MKRKIKWMIVLILSLTVAVMLFFYFQDKKQESVETNAVTQERVDFLNNQVERFLDSIIEQTETTIEKIDYDVSGNITVHVNEQEWESISDKEEFKNRVSTEIEWGLRNYGPFYEGDEIVVEWEIN
ncbi:hypothetical protein [Niallia sp. RD1]|uniref:hypothetical protein n=1 Tax=Niallia sp. RD1 TaxID=2962858 RepID=UPI0020C1AF17|nr:hypothetical protein [Niallia sp. RD1]UTI41136.1 hypothetical protein NKG37_20080 [Niallia sp. RD1]